MVDNENEDIKYEQNREDNSKTVALKKVDAVTVKNNDDCKVIDSKIACKEDTLNHVNCKTVLNKNKNKKVTSRSANTLFLLIRTVMCLSRVMQQWMLVLVFICFVGALKEQRFAIEPQDQSGVVGSRVTLPCRVEGKAGQLQWTKDDFGLGTHRHLVGYERYKMIGSDEEGDYSLDIENVTLDDDALYQCQVSSGSKGEPAIRSRYARLLVLVPPDPPKILQGPILQTVEDREVNLECLSVGGKPAAEITWVDNEGGVLTQGVTYTVEAMADGRRFTARSVLHLRPRRHHHNQSFTCQAQNTADRAYRSTSIKLLVLFAPKVKILIKSGLHKGVVKEGESLLLGCQASANPNNLTYKWYVSGERAVTAEPDMLVLNNVTRRYNQATIKCEVHNSVGKSADTKTVEVTYGPTFTMKPQDVETDLGSTVTLSCGVDGHPPPRILWLRYENDRVIRVSKSSNLTITVTAQSSGQYWCRASVDGYSDIETSAMVYVRGPPKIISNDTQYGIEGDSVRIDCVSFSVPKPDYVMWTFGGAEINSFHNNEYSFLEETLRDGIIRSSLIIRESQLSHFGVYNCSVSNFYGTDSVEIILIPEKSFPLILVATALSSAAVMLVMIMLIIMLCHRKTSSEKKPDITDVKTCYKESDRNSNISDLKLELRQVEGSCDETLNAGSETELHSSLHLKTNLGLPLAGPVALPDAGYDNELMKQYQRYSGDFNQAINFNFKTGQTNGYVPYVDYSRDYAPPSGDSLTGSLSRSIHSAFPSQSGSLQRQSSCGVLGLVGPDVIPMVKPGVMLAGGMDVRYAATYGNPYLRGSGPLSIGSQGSSSKPPPPYYSIRNSNLQIPATSVTSPTSSSSSSRPTISPLASLCSANSGAQPQVPKPQKGALYVLPPSSQGSLHTNKVTTKGNGAPTKAGTHV